MTVRESLRLGIALVAWASLAIGGIRPAVAAPRPASTSLPIVEPIPTAAATPSERTPEARASQAVAGAIAARALACVLFAPVVLPAAIEVLSDLPEPELDPGRAFEAGALSMIRLWEPSGSIACDNGLEGVSSSLVPSTPRVPGPAPRDDAQDAAVWSRSGAPPPLVESEIP